jgi:hypothetical protein
MINTTPKPFTQMKSIFNTRSARAHLIMVSLLGIAFVNEAFGQDSGIVSREVSWQTARSLELHSNQQGDRSCKVVTRKDKSIDLICGTDTLTFAIARVSGTWTDHTKDGSLKYDVTYLELPGKIVVSRNGEEVSVFIDFTEKVKDGMKRRFFVSQID